MDDWFKVYPWSFHFLSKNNERETPYVHVIIIMFDKEGRNTWLINFSNEELKKMNSDNIRESCAETEVSSFDYFSDNGFTSLSFIKDIEEQGFEIKHIFSSERCGHYAFDSCFKIAKNHILHMYSHTSIPWYNGG